MLTKNTFETNPYNHQLVQRWRSSNAKGYSLVTLPVLGTADAEIKGGPIRRRKMPSKRKYMRIIYIFHLHALFASITVIQNDYIFASNIIIMLYFIVPCGKFRSPYLGKAQQPQEQRYPFLSVCAVFSCVQTMVWLPVLGIFNVRTDVDACDCTTGLYRHRERFCTESSLKEKSQTCWEEGRHIGGGQHKWREGYGYGWFIHLGHCPSWRCAGGWPSYHLTAHTRIMPVKKKNNNLKTMCLN